MLSSFWMQQNLSHFHVENHGSHFLTALTFLSASHPLWEDSAPNFELAGTFLLLFPTLVDLSDNQVLEHGYYVQQFDLWDYQPQCLKVDSEKWVEAVGESYRVEIPKKNAATNRMKK